jgi:uncharacterized protein
VEPIRRAMVTGASSGIGAAFATALGARGVGLVVVARREERLRDLAATLPVEVEVLAADLGVPDERRRADERLRAADRPIDLLVNAAGSGAYGALHELAGPPQLAMIDVNVTALVALTHAALPGMVDRGRGGVINLGSIAGSVPGAHAAVYGGTKAFVGSFTQAVHEELRGTPVHVMLLAPGVVDTGYQAAAGIPSDALPSLARTSPDPVVAAALADFARRRAVCVPGALNKVAYTGGRVAPPVVTRRASALLHRRYAGA